MNHQIRPKPPNPIRPHFANYYGHIVIVPRRSIIPRQDLVILIDLLETFNYLEYSLRI